MAISTIPIFTGDIPDRNSQSAPVFTVNAIDWLDYQVIQIPATNTTVEGINLAVVSIDANTIAAAASAASANISDISSQANANFKGRWSDAVGAATIPATYSNNGQTWQLLQNIADITADEPLPLAANWQVVNDINMSNVNVSELDNPLFHGFKKNKFVETSKGNVSVTRNTIATRVDINKVVRDVAIDDPREEETGWLFEGASENLALHDSEFDNAVWTKTTSTITPNAALAPDNTMTADNWVSTALATNSVMTQPITLTSSSTYVISMYVKSNGAGKDDFRLLLDNASSANKIATNDWVRHIFVVVAGAGADVAGINRPSDDTEVDLLVWGTQVELLPFPSSGIATGATTETRSADDQSFPSAENFRESEGAIFLRADVIGDTGGSQSFVEISDGTVDNRIIILRSTNKIRVLIVKGGVTQAAIETLFNMDINTNFNVALNYKNNDVELFVDGTSIGTDTSATMPTGLTTVSVGKSVGGLAMFGHIQDLRFYPKRRTLDEIKYLGGT
jgi:hypothetical protein